MSEANKSIVNRLFVQVNAGELGVVDEVIADDFVEHEAMPGLAPGKEGARQLFTMFHDAFEGAAFEVDDLVAEDDTVVAMVRMTGTQGVSSWGCRPPGGRSTSAWQTASGSPMAGSSSTGESWTPGR